MWSRLSDPPFQLTPTHLLMEQSIRGQAALSSVWCVLLEMKTEWTTSQHPLQLSACSSQWNTTALLSAMVVHWFFLSVWNCLPGVRGMGRQLTPSLQQTCMAPVICFCKSELILHIKFGGGGFYMNIFQDGSTAWQQIFYSTLLHLDTQEAYYTKGEVVI